MGSSWKQHIEKQANAILGDASITSPPIPVRQAAEHLGLRVRSSEFDDSISGLLSLEGNQPVIGYNSLHPEVRQRFTIAHEIGHYVRHKDRSTLFIDEGYNNVFFRNDRSSEGEYTRELEANAFAASLLMPKEMLRQEVSKRDFDLAEESSLYELADLFKVSRQAMAYRLANSGIFDSAPEHV